MEYEIIKGFGAKRIPRHAELPLGNLNIDDAIKVSDKVSNTEYQKWNRTIKSWSIDNPTACKEFAVRTRDSKTYIVRLK